MMNYKVLLGVFLALMLTACGTTNKVVPENFPFQFNDNNPHQLASAKKYGIEPLDDRSQLTKKVLRKLRLVEDCEYYEVDQLTHSVPYLTPHAAKLLKDIGKGFQKKLKNKQQKKTT